MASDKLSAKGRRHARNIARSAVRRASKTPCIAGTDKPVKHPGQRWDIIEKREAQEKRIAAKRTRRRDTAALSPRERDMRSVAGQLHMKPSEMIFKGGQWTAKKQAAEE